MTFDRQRRAASMALAIMIAVPLGALLGAAPAAAAPVVYPLNPIPGLEYVAIAPLSFADNLKPLIDWKTSKGVPAQVFIISDIVAAYTGRDDAEKLHHFLQDLYFYKTSGTPKWLLLVGDGDWNGPTIPIREVYTNSQLDNDLTNPGNLYVTDTYYGGLESDWDENGNGVYGELNEGDWTPEMYVGRVPIDNETGNAEQLLDLWVARQVKYEKDPASGIWQHRAILAGALMDRPNVIDNPATAVDEGYDPFTDNARKVDEEVASVLPTGFDVTRFYDYPYWYGGNYSSSTDNLVLGALKTSMDAGAAYVTIEGHGYTSSRGVAQYTDPSGLSSIFRDEGEDPALTYDEIENMSNGDRLPFVYVSACYAGDFTDQDDTSFEQFLKAPGGGAIAAVAGNGENFRMENISGQQGYGNWWLATEFARMLFEGGYSQPGKVLGDLKERYNDYFLSRGPTDWINQQYFRAERVSYNLMGDPEFSLIKGDVVSLEAQPVRQPLVGQSTVAIAVRDGSGPVADALVRVNGSGGDVHGRTNATGIVTLAYSFANASAVDLTVTAGSHRPLFSSFAPAVPEHNLAFDPPALTGHAPVVRGTAVTVSGTVVARGIAGFSNVEVELRTGNPITGNVIGAAVMPFVAPGAPYPFSYDVTLDNPGDTLVYATVDPASLQAEDTHADNVAAVTLHANFPPQFAALPALTMREGGALPDALRLAAYAADSDDGAANLQYRVASVSDPRLEAFLGGDRLSLRAASNWSGDATVMLEAADGLESARAALTVHITASNLPPAIEPVMDARAVVGTPFTLQVQGADPEGRPLTWTDDSPLFQIDAQGRIAFLPTSADVGRYLVKVSASDGAAFSSHTFVLTVDASKPPIEVRNLPRIEAPAGRPLVVDLNLVSSDPEVTFVTDRNDVDINSSARTLTYTPAPGTSRLETILITASKPGFPAARVAVTVAVVAPDSSLDVGAEAGLAIGLFAAAAAAFAALLFLVNARAHAQRLRDERIFKIEGKPPKKGGKRKKKSGSGKTGAAKGSLGQTAKSEGAPKLEERAPPKGSPPAEDKGSP